MTTPTDRLVKMLHELAEDAWLSPDDPSRTGALKLRHAPDLLAYALLGETVASDRGLDVTAHSGWATPMQMHRTRSRIGGMQVVCSICGALPEQRCSFDGRGHEV